MTAISPKKVGRNELCHCGSGQKYKKCCLGKEEALRPVPPASPLPQAAGVDLGLEGLRMNPHTVAKIAEDPAAAHGDRRILAAIAKHLRDNWTLAKVSVLSTDSIEDQLRRYGVRHSEVRFRELAAACSSAWSICEHWRAEDPLVCRGKEEDFLGLAACELWKRWLPERPSIEMLDDWMQDGYRLVEEQREDAACDLWWQVWCVLRSRFTKDMVTMRQAESVFAGTQSIYNWAQDFEMHLGNAAVRDGRYLTLGETYCRDWLAQFSGELGLTCQNFRAALANFVGLLGRAAEGEQILLENINLWPDEPWTHIRLSDVLAETGPQAWLGCDKPRAQALLLQGLARVPTSAMGYEELRRRLKELGLPLSKDG